MARLFVADDNGTPLVEVFTDTDGKGRVEGRCVCGESDFGRPYDPVADHVEAAEIHVDGRH